MVCAKPQHPAPPYSEERKAARRVRCQRAIVRDPGPLLGQGQGKRQDGAIRVDRGLLDKEAGAY